MDHDIGRFFEHRLSVGKNRNAPGRVRRANHLAEIAPGLCGIFIDSADNFEQVLLAHQAHDRSADGADSILDDADFLFQWRIPERF